MSQKHGNLEGEFIKANLADELINRQIKPSYHRVRILRYLIDNQNHPTVDQIYLSLQKELPTLSKATIYNTLNLFVASRLARVITIADKEARYDITVKDHGHFKCETCGNIYDFEIEIDKLEYKKLDGFQINNKNVYFKGICSRCLKIKK